MPNISARGWGSGLKVTPFARTARVRLTKLSAAIGWQRAFLLTENGTSRVCPKLQLPLNLRWNRDLMSEFRLNEWGKQNSMKKMVVPWIAFIIFYCRIHYTIVHTVAYRTGQTLSMDSTRKEILVRETMIKIRDSIGWGEAYVCQLKPFGWQLLNGAHYIRSPLNKS